MTQITLSRLCLRYLHCELTASICTVCDTWITRSFVLMQCRIPSAHFGSYRGDRRGSTATSGPEPVVLEAPKKPQCWDHGCNGRHFSTFSNLLRHQREKSGTSQKSVCHRCGAEFTRKTARDGHLAHDKCKPRSDR